MMRRHRRRRTCRKHHIESRRRDGWGMNLYRNKSEGKIAGVCAGLADHFDFDPWVVRLFFIAGFVFLNGLAIFAYVAGWMLMAPASDNAVESVEYDERRHSYRRKNMFRHSASPSRRLQEAQRRLNGVMRRVEDMEAYVTSRQYELNREFSNMER
ncbi:envelope stress response membrane protein PspC [Pseudomaricurvus alkylphenolicus]|uniref:envelope stress response membrane protein PspC n=1 Tax=Pseudomaricurvus alkylphenolicus TaxID=1306991 RepID=UPI00141E76D9|nr:envelope stress response membrane protein PspC [Pseudomaricurvus alkylphenolicus]NIB43913.1 envelope stress response membrane protein PspC [Pseudomaricurvus alkylphenolicus]